MGSSHKNGNFFHVSVDAGQARHLLPVAVGKEKEGKGGRKGGKKKKEKKEERGKEKKEERGERRKGEWKIRYCSGY